MDSSVLLVRRCLLLAVSFGGDPSWLNGTAMSWHYWTQPLPNPVSAYMHRLPLWWHRLETHATFVHETLAACFVFAPVALRIFAFLAFEGLMAVINITGNYASVRTARHKRLLVSLLRLPLCAHVDAVVGLRLFLLTLQPNRRAHNQREPAAPQ
jgi:hypothetical protein